MGAGAEQETRVFQPWSLGDRRYSRSDLQEGSAVMPEFLRIEFLASVMQVVTGLSAALIAAIVYLHNRRRDEEDFLRMAWDSQQQLNYLACSHVRVAKAADLMTAGLGDGDLDEDTVRTTVYLLFIQINRLNAVWRAMNNGIISRKKALAQVEGTLSVIYGEPRLFHYCLSSGYNPAFRSFLESRVKTSMRPKPGRRRDIIEAVIANPPSPPANGAPEETGASA